MGRKEKKPVALPCGLGRVRPEGNCPAFTEVAKVSVTGLFFCSGIEHAKCVFPALDIFKKAILKTVFFKKKNRQKYRKQKSKPKAGQWWHTHTFSPSTWEERQTDLCECEDAWSTE